MKLSFWGASGQVTGSMYQIISETGYQILVDCGLSYEKHQDFSENQNLPFDASAIDAVIITHAHIDHTGNLPTLVKAGFKGNIFCTPPTLELMEALLDDSASIQGKSKKKNQKRLYGYKEVKDVIDKCITLPFHHPFNLSEEISFEYYPAGHILGAASVVFEITKKKPIRIGFTGDLGPDHASLIPAPEPMKNLDYLVCESTYGSRLHRDTNPGEILLKEINQVCVQQGGRLIIPAFSVGRTQSILFELNKLFRKGLLPKNILIMNDSPLAISSSKIHLEYLEYLNESAQSFFTEFNSLLEFKQLYTLEDDDDQELPAYASILISSAGMLEGGRIREHVLHHIHHPSHKIFMAGFCAPGTLGYDILNHKGGVKIFNKHRDVYCQVGSTDVFSAHPDSTGLMQYVQKVNETSDLIKIFLTHGDGASLMEFKSKLENYGFANVEIPAKGDKYLLNV